MPKALAVASEQADHDRVGRADDLQRTGRRGVAAAGAHARARERHDHSTTEMVRFVVSALHRGVLSPPSLTE